ncbi:MAG: site-2 protease family protein [Ruminococcus sp.]|nr:site-2 protease family protein [Ruminococcus sp.]
MRTVGSIIFAVLMFELIIVIHEFGHFIVARLNKVKVNEFAIGMGPAIFKKQGKNTLFALRIIPFGGYCAMEGEDGDSDDSGAFCKKKVWRRITIVIAGVVMNLILGFILLLINTATSGPYASTTISYFEQGASSHETGLELGDRIVKINGMRIFTTMDMSFQFKNDKDGVFDIVVERNGEMKELKDVKFATGEGTMHIDFKVKPVELGVGSVISQSLKTGASDARLIFISLRDIITGKYSLRELSGPVGIVDTIGDVVDSETDKETGKIDWASLAHTMLSICAFITINIGIFNLLPLPALDGGRLVFLIIEGIRRKPVKPEHEGMVHFIGLIILLVLMAVITVSDIIKLF